MKGILSEGAASVVTQASVRSHTLIQARARDQGGVLQIGRHPGEVLIYFLDASDAERLAETAAELARQMSEAAKLPKMRVG